VKQAKRKARAENAVASRHEKVAGTAKGVRAKGERSAVGRRKRGVTDLYSRRAAGVRHNRAEPRRRTAVPNVRRMARETVLEFWQAGGRQEGRGEGYVTRGSVSMPRRLWRRREPGKMLVRTRETEGQKSADVRLSVASLQCDA